jgi:hypothetical protein
MTRAQLVTDPAILEAIRQETAAAVRSVFLDALGVMSPAGADGSTDAIEAELLLDIYTARRRARERMLGLAPVPEPSAEAVELLRRVKAAEPPEARDTPEPAP